jgi:hypothetical protein
VNWYNFGIIVHITGPGVSNIDFDLFYTNSRSLHSHNSPSIKQHSHHNLHQPILAYISQILSLLHNLQSPVTNYQERPKPLVLYSQPTNETAQQQSLLQFHNTRSSDGEVLTVWHKTIHLFNYLQSLLVGQVRMAVSEDVQAWVL